MAEGTTKIPFSDIQQMLAERLGVADANSITPETTVSKLPKQGVEVASAVREGVIGLMGQYFEARPDEVDVLFDTAVQSVHPLSLLPVTMSAETVHHIAESLYEILERHN